MSVKTRYHIMRPRRRQEPFSSMDGWAKLVFVMLLGSSFGRAFYYIGFPPAKIFIGDIVLVLFFLLRPKELCDRWITALTKGNVFGPFARTLLLSLMRSLIEVL